MPGLQKSKILLTEEKKLSLRKELKRHCHPLPLSLHL